MTTKICNVCKTEFPLTDEFFPTSLNFDKKSNKFYLCFRANCWTCRNLKEKEYRKTYNKEAQLTSKRKYSKTPAAKECAKRFAQSEKGKKLKREQVKRWRTNHLEIVRKWEHRAVKKAVDTLSDSYIKRIILSGLQNLQYEIHYSQINNSSIIEAERQRLLLKREIKNQQQNGKNRIREEHCSDARVI